jgi:hypothetical protein
MSIVTIIIDENSAQSAIELQQQHNKQEINESGQKPFASLTLQTNSKGFGNINLSVDEAGDIFCGWSNDGLIKFQKQST